MKIRALKYDKNSHCLSLNLQAQTHVGISSGVSQLITFYDFPIEDVTTLRDFLNQIINNNLVNVNKMNLEDY